MIVGNPIVKCIENIVRRRYTRGIFDTIMPFFLKSHYSSQIIQNIKNSDLVLFHGAGLIADHLSLYVPTYLFELFLAKKLGKKVCTVNLSVSVKDELLRNIVFFVMKQADYHIVREQLSRQYLIDIGIEPSKIEISPDFAVICKAEKESAISNGLSKKVLPENSAAVIIRGDRNVNYNVWISFVNYLTSRYNLNVIFLHTCRAHDYKVFKILSKYCSVRELEMEYDY